MKIISSGSARGLSLSAYVSCFLGKTEYKADSQILETASYGISLAYASRNHFPFSTYGENFFLTIQNIVITLLIIFFSGSSGAQPSGLASSGKSRSLGQKGNLKGAVSGLVLVVLAGLALGSKTLCPPSIRKSKPPGLPRGQLIFSLTTPVRYPSFIHRLESTPNHLEPAKSVYR